MTTVNENPYASPSTINAAPNSQLVMRRLHPPAICLLVSAILLITMFALNLLGIILMDARQMNEVAEMQRKFWTQYGHIYAVMMLSSAMIIYAALQMLRGRQYTACVIGAILAVIPVLSPCFVLAIPFAIWALVLLLRKDTRAAFAETK